MNPHLLRLGDSPWPPDLEVLYGRRAPFVIEVGFGNGGFLQELSRLHPEWSLLGVEIAPTSITRAYRLARREHLDNVRLMHGHGAFAVREIAPRRGLHRVYLNFPDPWPKEKHLTRRLLRESFFRMLSTRLEDGGALLFTTDHQEYFEYALAQAEATDLYDIEVKDPPDEMLSTKYAQRWLEMRMTIHHVAFVKKGEAPEPHPHTVEVVEVQHIRLEGSMDQIGDFKKSARRLPDGQVVLRNCYRGFEESVVVFLCIVEEADLRQHVLIEVRPSAGGIYVALMGFGAPVITRAVKEAVRSVSIWLQGRGMTVIEEAL